MDAADRKLLADVQEYGWHKITVSEDAEGPGFTYTIGLFHSFQHPEVIVFGLPDERMRLIVDSIAELVQSGVTLADGSESDQILEHYSCTFRAVLPVHYPAHLGYARWFYKAREFPVLQCCWPDRTGRYPWELDCEREIIRLQPALYDPTLLPWEGAKGDGAA